MKNKKRIGILGGGPSALFLFKRLVESKNRDFTIDIFEKQQQLGSGMPYSYEGANEEHVTNVSGNEIPKLVTSVAEWIQTLPPDLLEKFHIDPKKFSEYKVLPRLLFGKYLSAQFDLLLRRANETGVDFKIHLSSTIIDIIDHPGHNTVEIKTDKNHFFSFNTVIICTGHNWPKKHEGIVPGYFDSPYPPSKLKFKANHPIAIKGSSLTAIDAIRTLARYNGNFRKDENNLLSYELSKDCPDFRLMMYSINGLLPALRFHLDDPHLSKDSVLSAEEINSNRSKNENFLSLDFVFEKNFKDSFKDKDPAFYKKIKSLDMEAFVTLVMGSREQIDPFQLFKFEYSEAEKSIRRKESVYWKEMLAVLSFAMNYPAKYFSAEDMLRLQKVLMPLISVVIAFVPQNSAEELLALYRAGILNVTRVNENSSVEVKKEGGIVYHYINESNQQLSLYYKTYVDCVGQPHLSLNELPYKSLADKKTVSQARLKFKHSDNGVQEIKKGNKELTKDSQGNYYMNVPGITINDAFQVVDEDGVSNERIYMMAVPYIGGYNPDYSGLDFCEAASRRIIESIVKK